MHFLRAILFFSFTVSIVFAQKPIIKKRTAVTYDHWGWADTTINEYDSAENVIKTASYLSPYVGRAYWVDSLIAISNTDSHTHMREYWCDSTTVEVYIRDFQDSLIEVKIKEGDTIQINRQFFNKGRLVKSSKMKLHNDFLFQSQVILFEKKTKSRTRAMIIRFAEYPYPTLAKDTIFFDNHYKRRIYKTLIFNPLKRKWLVSKKAKVRDHKKVTIAYWWDEDFKKYPPTITTIRYNEYGHIISEIVYDRYLREIEKKVLYKYEYW
ncbi:MAG: hypothetical protein AB8F95_07365 [Bacteroidia bacterium]